MRTTPSSPLIPKEDAPPPWLGGWGSPARVGSLRASPAPPSAGEMTVGSCASAGLAFGGIPARHPGRGAGRGLLLLLELGKCFQLPLTSIWATTSALREKLKSPDWALWQTAWLIRQTLRMRQSFRVVSWGRRRRRL